MADSQCENCYFWDNSAQCANKEPDTTGQCRIDPPRKMAHDGMGVWPFTEDEDWCGRWLSRGAN